MNLLLIASLALTLSIIIAGITHGAHQARNGGNER